MWFKNLVQLWSYTAIVPVYFGLSRFRINWQINIVFQVPISLHFGRLHDHVRFYVHILLYFFYSFSYYNRTYKQGWEWRRLTVQVIVSVWFKNPIMHISSSHFIKTTLAEDKEKNKGCLICILPRCISNVLSWL